MTRPVDEVFQELRESFFRMGAKAEAILDKSMRSIWERDAALAAEVADDDLEIDRLDIEIDDLVLKALALQAPVARDLRGVLAVKMMATDIERVGDLARNIAKSSKRLAAAEELQIPAALTSLARSSQRLFRNALDAYSHADADLARAVLEEDDAVDDVQDEVVRTILRSLPNNSDLASQEVDLIFVAKNLERVADHATNIAEDVILVIEAVNVKHADKLDG